MQGSSGRREHEKKKEPRKKYRIKTQREGKHRTGQKEGRSNWRRGGKKRNRNRGRSVSIAGKRIRSKEKGGTAREWKTQWSKRQGLSKIRAKQTKTTDGIENKREGRGNIYQKKEEGMHTGQDKRRAKENAGRVKKKGERKKQEQEKKKRKKIIKNKSERRRG
jgi:hypothetical protein